MSRWIAIDPGENTGWSVWEDKRLLYGGQDPLWDVIDEIDEWIQVGTAAGCLYEGENCHNESLGAIVCEDWVLYEWKLQDLAWDKCRTARGIGALELLARRSGLPIILQPATIKEAAVAAGAEQWFRKPLHENRHQNDSIMHGVFYLAKNGGPPCTP